MASRELRRIGGEREQTHLAPAELIPWSGRLRRGKLRQPLLPSSIVERLRLLQQADEEDRPLILVVAPAGFGKTTFAAQWAARGPHTAWLTIDPRDVSLDRFWAHLRLALAESSDYPTDLGEVVTAALAIPHRASAVDLGRMFADELLDFAGPVRLVLDDLHQVARGEIHGFLSGLLEIAPPGFQVMITSRVEPPLPLARMRLRGTMSDIRGDDLLFTTRETELLLRRIGPQPAAVDGNALQQHTKGWAAGLRLAAFAAQSGPLSSERADPARSERELLSWMLEETLAGRPEAERALLLHAALLDRFNARVLRAMTNGSASGPAVRAAIDFATRADLCRHSAQGERDWLEFHPLFRDALRQQLAEEVEVETVRALHERAATWFEQEGYVDEAIAHRLAGGDLPAAVAIVQREMGPAFNRENWPAVARWLTWIPGDLIQQTPRLLLAQGMVAQFRGQQVPLTEMQITIEGRMASANLEKAEVETLRGEFESLRINASTAADIDPQAWLAMTQRAISRIDPSHRFELGVAWMHYGMALAATGQPRQAIRRLEEWIEISGPEIDAGSIRGFLGLLLVYAQEGMLTLGQSTARSMIALAERNELRLSAGWAHRFLGDVLYELNDLDGAIEHYSAAASDHEYFHLKGLREALCGLALSYLAVGRQEEAWRALRRSREIAVAAGVVYHLPMIEAQEAYLALQTGNRSRAAVWAAAHEPSLSSEPFSTLIHPAVIHGAILSASDDPREVARGIAGLRAVREEMLRWGYPGPLVRAEALLAMALQRWGDQRAALTSLEASLAAGREHGHTRSYLDLLPVFTAELTALAAQTSLPEALRQTLPPAVPAEPSAPAPGQAQIQSQDRGALPLGPLHALTEREREVLHCLFQRLSYREIGDQLYISPHTVKRHVTSIYSKLNVSGRTEAIQEARELGWTG